jgi:hypothetical protein
VTRVDGDVPLAALFFTRDCEFEDCTARFVWFSPKAPAVALDDRAANRQSHPNAVWFCRVESFENRFYFLRIDSKARIADCQNYSPHLTCSTDEELARLIRSVLFRPDRPGLRPSRRRRCRDTPGTRRLFQKEVCRSSSHKLWSRRRASCDKRDRETADGH